MSYIDEDGQEQETIVVPNPEVLRAGVRHIEQHIKSWNQSDWIKVGSAYPDEQETCGTTACLAGHILLAQGHKWRDLREDDIPERALSALGFERGTVERDEFDNDIFYYVSDDRGGTLAYTEENLAVFKEWITKVTGVEL